MLVVTEGERTEPQYIERLEAHLRSHSADVTVKTVGVGKDPLKVVRRCMEERAKARKKDQPYDQCFCLVDVDEHASLSDALELAWAEEIDMIVSNLKFEVWLRWHVEAAFSSLSSSQLDDVVAKHKLLLGKALSLSFPIGAVDEACERAHRADPELATGRVGPDPSTAMPMIVAAMRGGGRVI